MSGMAPETVISAALWVGVCSGRIAWMTDPDNIAWFAYVYIMTIAPQQLSGPVFGNSLNDRYSELAFLRDHQKLGLACCYIAVGVSVCTIMFFTFKMQVIIIMIISHGS